ncbi:hypothetical protein [Asaia astilbis]
MKQSDFSPQFATLWGAQADTSHMQSPIPSTSSDNGRASLALGFPPANFTAPEAGGTFMYGQDLNGSLKMLSTSAQNYESGVIPPFSASFAASIGGYPAGAVVADTSTAGVYWRSTQDNNTTTPGASGAAWTNFFGGYLATSGPAQSSSAYTAFTNGLSANNLSAPNGAADIKISSGIRMASQVLYCNAIAPDGASDLKVTTDIRMGVQTIFANLFATDGTATRKFQGTTSVSDAWSFNQAPSIPVGSVSWSGTNTSTLSVGDAYSYFVRGSGASQTVSAATNFTGGLTVPLGISSTATSNTAVLATGDAFLSFMRLGGAAQSSNAPTTFSNGLFVPLGISSTAASNTAVLATGDAFLSFMRLGGAAQSSSAPTTFSNGLFVNALGAPSGSSDITINAGLRMNSQTAYVNKIATDGSEIRSISGVTNVADLWNFYTRPNFNGSGLALLSEVTPKLTIPGASSPWIQQVSATYNANDGSNGTLINIPSAYPNACLYAFGNDVGNGALAWGIQIVNSGSIRIWGKLGTTYQTGGINLYTIGW